MAGVAARCVTSYCVVEAIPCFQKGLEINPIMPRSWFTLGCACVWTEQWREARLAFQRCVSLEDEDAESWNNLASVYLKSEDLTPPDLQINVEDDDEVCDVLFVFQKYSIFPGT